MFAVGYLIAALLPGIWLKLIERWNVYGTFVFLIVLFALSTPIADPMRLAVDSQVARLQSGAVKPDKFDFAYLRRDGGRFGQRALEALKSSPDAVIRERALAPLTNGPTPFIPSGGRVDLAKTIKVYPAGKSLPPSFVGQDWTNTSHYDEVYQCLIGHTAPNMRCDAIVRDFDGDNADEVLVIYSASGLSPTWWAADMFKRSGERWQSVANTSSLCPSDREALLAGKFETVMPVQRDFVIAGKRIEMNAAAVNAPCK